jgi:hypothetical protein
MTVRALVCACALGLALPSDAGERLDIRLSTIAAFAPANLNVWVTVEADPDNRAIRVIAESPDFYRSSERPIEGVRAGRTNAFEFRNLPSGMYVVSAVLVDCNGHEFKARRDFEVMGGEH